MSKQRLIFYSDARHTHIYAYDPPLRVEDAVAPVDDVAGTGVDTFVYGFGAGLTMYHNTEMGETWAEHLIKAGKTTFREPEIHNTFPFWRAYSNIKSLRDRGLDLLELLTDRAHEKGLQMWGSIRTNHGQDPAFIDTADNSTFQIDHPELHLTTAPGHPFNWAYPEVRAERLALFEEAVTNYDLDGMEIDFAFSQYLFEQGQVEENKHLVTEFMADARRIVDKAATDKGKPFALGARVFPTPESNAATGLDIADWLADGLVDFLVPAVYGPMQMDVNFPIEWLVDLTDGTNCEVYPALLNKVFSVHTSGIHQTNRRIYEHAATPEHFRAGAAAYWAKGADGIYLPWFDWPVGPDEKQVLSEIHDPDLLREKSKHYWSPTQDVDGDYEAYASQLPITLETGVEASEQVVHLYLADDDPGSEVHLRLKLTGSVAADVMSVTLNGAPLDWETCRITRHGGGGDIFAWADFPIEPDMLRRGVNHIGVAVLSRPENLVANVVLQSVEVLVDYPGNAAATEFDRISLGRRL